MDKGVHAGKLTNRLGKLIGGGGGGEPYFGQGGGGNTEKFIESKQEFIKLIEEQTT
jgi:alanyl-tRNA synthetase